MLATDVDMAVHVDGISEAGRVSTRSFSAAVSDSAFANSSSPPPLSVHGEIRTPALTRTLPFFKPDIYGASKYLAARMLAATSEQMPSIPVRLPGVLDVGTHRLFYPFHLFIAAIFAGMVALRLC